MYYKKDGSTTWESITPEKTEYDHPPSDYSRRNIFTALVTGLEPKSTYIFKLENSAWDNPVEELYSYKTFNEDDFTILLGGDVGNKQEALNMNQNVVSKVKIYNNF